MLKTKGQVVDELRVELYAGQPSVDASISTQFVLRKLNNKIALAAQQNALGNYKLDGIVCVDDIFTLTYSSLTLTVDPIIGLKYVELPAQPVDIPLNQSITVFPPANRGGMLSDIFKPATRGKITLVRSLPNLKKVYHFTENGREYFEDEWDIMDTFDTLNMSIITSGANDLTAFINVPDDMIDIIKKECLLELRGMMALSDTTPLPTQDSPQPRD